MAKTIYAPTAREAAIIRAEQIARREYGRARGGCHHVRTDHWTEDGTHTTFEAYIGRWQSNGGMSGHNIWLYVTGGDSTDKDDEMSGEPLRRYSVNA